MPDFDTDRCLRFPNQARFHPLKYLEGLARSILTKGGVLRPFTAVDSITQTGDTVAVKTRSGQTILARDVVCATNAPIAGRLTLQAKMAPYRSYAMAFEVPKESVTDALYWDTLDAYHYVRLQPGEDKDYLIVGGEDHKTGEADDASVRFEGLKAWARRRFGDLRGSDALMVGPGAGAGGFCRLCRTRSRQRSYLLRYRRFRARASPTARWPAC